MGSSLAELHFELVLMITKFTPFCDLIHLCQLSHNFHTLLQPEIERLTNVCYDPVTKTYFLVTRRKIDDNHVRQWFATGRPHGFNMEHRIWSFDNFFDTPDIFRSIQLPNFETLVYLCELTNGKHSFEVVLEGTFRDPVNLNFSNLRILEVGLIDEKSVEFLYSLRDIRLEAIVFNEHAKWNQILLILRNSDIIFKYLYIIVSSLKFEMKDLCRILSSRGFDRILFSFKDFHTTISISNWKPYDLECIELFSCSDRCLIKGLRPER